MEDITKTISVFCFMQHSLLSAYRIQERILQQPVLLVSQAPLRCILSLQIQRLRCNRLSISLSQ